MTSSKLLQGPSAHIAVGTNQSIRVKPDKQKWKIFCLTAMPKKCIINNKKRSRKSSISWSVCSDVQTDRPALCLYCLYMQKRRDSTFLRVCYVALWHCVSSSVKRCVLPFKLRFEENPHLGKKKKTDMNRYKYAEGERGLEWGNIPLNFVSSGKAINFHFFQLHSVSCDEYAEAESLHWNPLARLSWSNSGKCWTQKFSVLSKVSIVWLISRRVCESII